MTERVEPWSTTMIAWLRRSTPEHLEPHTLTQLADIAEDHARLVAEGATMEQVRAANLNIVSEFDMLKADYNALRAELARIRAHIESSHNEVTCSQDARHANDGDDRVPMLTCMTWEAHTLRAELTAMTRERDLLLLSPENRLDGYRELGAKCAASEAARDDLRVEVARLRAEANQYHDCPGCSFCMVGPRPLDALRAENAKLRERVGKLEELVVVARERTRTCDCLPESGCVEARFHAALVVCDEEPTP